MKFGIKTILGLVLIGLIFAGLASQRGSALEPSWISSALKLDQLASYTLPDDIATLQKIGINKIPCFNTNLALKPQIKIGNTIVQSKQTIAACVYSFNGGYFSASNNYAQLDGTKVAGKLKSQMSTSSKLIPVPGSSALIELVSAGGYAYKVYMYSDPYSKITASVDMYGQVTYTLPVPSSGPLKNADGGILYVDPNTLRLADNGQWFIADGLNSGFVRVNTGTYQVLSFASQMSSSSTTVYSLNAVSDDGRYAVIVTSAPSKVFTIYDLGTCVKKTGILIQTCQSKNLLSATKQILPSFNSGISAVNFVNDNLIQFYGDYDYISASNRKFGTFSLSNDGQNLTKVNYLALGDSFSSGEGSYNYRPETNTIDNQCHQSFYSYGFILSVAAPSAGSFKSITCSGAKIKDVVLTTETEKDYNEKNSQAKGKTDTNYYDNEIYSEFLPGYRLQKNFVAQNKPQIITMSMGGNDIGFSDIIKKCVLSYGVYDCYQFYEDRKDLVNLMNNQYSRLLDTYQKLKEAAAPNARIYIIGYPQIAVQNGNCALNVHFTDQEIAFGNELVSYLNSIIKLAADHAGVFYVDTEQAFAGHRMCETASSDVAVNGLTISNNPPLNKPVASESYHPNKLGHELFAKNIASQTAGLTAPMPAAVSGDPVYPNDADIALLKNAPKENRDQWEYRYSSTITDDVVYKDKLMQLTAGASEYGLKPNEQYSIVAYSTPIVLGTVVTDASGNLSAALPIDGSLQPGYHTIHIRGKNIIGEAIDIEKIVYVAATANDSNGNGINDGAETCGGIVSASSIDADKDGVDDACDGYIGEPPVEPLPAPDPEPSPPPAQDAQNPQDQSTIPDYKLNDSLPVYNPAEQPPVQLAAAIANPPATYSRQYYAAPQAQSTPQDQPVLAVKGVQDKKPEANMAVQEEKIVTTNLLLPLMVIGALGGVTTVWLLLNRWR